MDKKFFSEINVEFVNLFISEIHSAKSIVISSHTSPDDDSISSVLAVNYYLTKYRDVGKAKIRMMYTGEKTDKWKQFYGYDDVEFVDDIYGYLKPTDLVIFVDGSGWRRFSRRDEINKFKGTTICIDHHPTPEDKFNLHLVAKNYTSCAEIIYKLFFEKEKLDKYICEILFLGISGDTGNFRFLGPESSETFSIAGRLVREGGFNVQLLQSGYQRFGPNVFTAFASLMKNSMQVEINHWPKAMVSWLDSDFVKDQGMSDNDISEASNQFTFYINAVKGTDWGFVVTPRTREKSSAISARSLPGTVSVRLFMEQTKLGGGHDRAAGGKAFNKNPKETVNFLLAFMEKNRPVML